MNGQQVIDFITNEIQSLKDRFDDDSDYYCDLAHVFFGDEVVPYVKECIKNDITTLKKLLSLISEEYEKGDKYFNNVIDVSFLESIYYDRECYEELKSYMPSNLLEHLTSFEN